MGGIPDYEMLKIEDWHIEARLPICPKCKNTKNVNTLCASTTLAAGLSKYLLGCTECEVMWRCDVTV